MTDRDWNMRGARLAGFQFAEWLVLNSGRDDNFVDEYDKNANQARAVAQASGFVETVRPHRNDGCRPGYRGQDAWPRLTGAGHLEVERVRSLRSDLHARAQACREALLLWLTREGRGAGSAGLLAGHAGWRFYDTPFTVGEVNEAARFLREAGLIEGWDYPGGTVMNPRLTVSGTQCVEFFDADVREFLHPSLQGGTVTNQQNFYGAVNGQVAQGQNVTQTQRSGIDAAALAEIFEAMRAALSTIEDPHDRHDVEHGIQQLEEAVQGGDAEAVTQSAGRVQRLATRVGKAAGNTAITAATTEGVNQLLVALGIG